VIFSNHALPNLLNDTKRRLPLQRDLEQVWQRAREHEAEIWRILVTEKRTVTREAYRRLAEALPTNPIPSASGPRGSST